MTPPSGTFEDQTANRHALFPSPEDRFEIGIRHITMQQSFLQSTCFKKQSSGCDIFLPLVPQLV